MKRSELKLLISEIVNAVLREEDTADYEINKAKRTVVDKLKNNKDLSEPESELAVSSADKSQRSKLGQNIENQRDDHPLLETNFVANGKFTPEEEKILFRSGFKKIDSDPALYKFDMGFRYGMGIRYVNFIKRNSEGCFLWCKGESGIGSETFFPFKGEKPFTETLNIALEYIKDCKTRDIKFLENRLSKLGS